MANRAASPRPSIGRKDSEVYAMLRTALRHAFTRSGASVRDGAHWMRVAPSTAQRALAGKVRVNVAHVLRSRRLSKHFIGCLALLNGRAP